MRGERVQIIFCLGDQMNNATLISYLKANTKHQQLYVP